MKRRHSAGRFKKRASKDIFRMKKKSRAKLQMERYARTMAYIANEEDNCLWLMSVTNKEILREREEAKMLATSAA